MELNYVFTLTYLPRYLCSGDKLRIYPYVFTLFTFHSIIKLQYLTQGHLLQVFCFFTMKRRNKSVATHRYRSEYFSLLFLFFKKFLSLTSFRSLLKCHFLVRTLPWIRYQNFNLQISICNSCRKHKILRFFQVWVTITIKSLIKQFI